MARKIRLYHFIWEKKIFDMANNPKFNYFTEMDDHMMNYDENLINEIDLFIRTLN